MRYCLTGEQDLLTNKGEIATQHDGIKANPLIVKYQEVLVFIKKNGYSKFIKLADQWTGPCEQK